MRDPRTPGTLRSPVLPMVGRRDLLRAGAALAAAPLAAPAARTFAAPAIQSDPRQLVVVDDLPAQWFYLDPARIYEVDSQIGMQLVYECLYHIPDGADLDAIVPLLAEDLPTYSDDGLTATIALRPGITFAGSGNEVTAEDWVWSWNRLKNVLGNPSFLFSEFFESVSAPDPRTLELKLTSPNAVLPAVLTTTVFSVTDRLVGQEHGGSAEEGADADDTLTDWLNEGNSIGTGPYVLAQWDPTSEIILEANPDYRGEAPGFAAIVFRNVTEASSQLQLLETGEADIALVVDPDQIGQVEANAGLQMLSGPSLAVDFLAMNTTEEGGGVLANKDVRQAIAHAVDYAGIIDGLSGGLAVRPASPVPLGLLGAAEVEDQRYETNTERANELWAASGVGPAEVVFTYDATGSMSTGVSVELLAAKLQEDLQRIEGLTIRLEPMDPAQRLQAFRDGELQMTYSGWSPDYADVHTYADPFARDGGIAAKRVGFANAEATELLAEGIVETDPAARLAVYRRIQEILIDEVPFLPIVQPTYTMPAAASVVGAEPHGTYVLQLRFASKEG